MDFAIQQGKNPRATWDKIVEHSKKARKRTRNPVLSASVRPTASIVEQGLSYLKILSEILILTAILFGLVQVYLFLTRSPYLAVSEVNVYGSHKISQEKLMAWTGPVKGQNIFMLDIAKIARQLEKHPWIQQVSVERKLPTTFHIHIRERTPMIRIQLDKTYLMDKFGVLLEGSPENTSVLPTILGIKEKNTKLGMRINHAGLAPSLQMMHYLNQLSYFQNNPIDSVIMEGTERAIFITSSKQLRIRMSLDNPGRTFENLKSAFGAMKNDLTGIESIDLTFKDQVLVKNVDGNIKATHRS